MCSTTVQIRVTLPFLSARYTQQGRPGETRLPGQRGHGVRLSVSVVLWGSSLRDDSTATGAAVAAFAATARSPVDRRQLMSGTRMWLRSSSARTTYRARAQNASFQPRFLRTPPRNTKQSKSWRNYSTAVTHAYIDYIQFRLSARGVDVVVK